MKFLVQYPVNTVKIIGSGLFEIYIKTNNSHYNYTYHIPAYLRSPRVPVFVLYLLIVFWLLKQWIVFGWPIKRESLNHIALFSLSLQFVSFFCVCVFADACCLFRHSLIPLFIGIISLTGMGIPGTQQEARELNYQ